jgi:hypothetical protein
MRCRRLSGGFAVRKQWQDAPIVFTVACGCPYCGSPDHQRTDQVSHGDGAVERFCVCRQCSRIYRNVVEPFPFHDSGELVDWLRYISPNGED